MIKIFKKMICRLLPLVGLSKKRLAFPVFRQDFYSQNGEDGVIEFIIHKVPDIPKYVVDIGANDGVTHSNSRLLIEKYGFSGLLIEPFANAFVKLKKVYEGNDNVVLSNKAVGSGTEKEIQITWHDHFTGLRVPVFNVNSVFSENNVPKDIGFLSIDTDGHDNEILAAIDWIRFRPFFVIAEIDSSSDRNLQEQINIMHGFDYVPLIHMGNVIYCRLDVVGKYLFNWRLGLKNEFGLFWQ